MMNINCINLRDLKKTDWKEFVSRIEVQPCIAFVRNISENFLKKNEKAYMTNLKNIYQDLSE